MALGDFSNILSYSRLSSFFGLRDRPLPTASKNHMGVDLAAPLDTAIYSPTTPGVVTSVAKSGSDRKRGYWIVLKNVLPSGAIVFTEYMHMQQPTAQTSFIDGQYIDPHTVIGQVGSTGSSTGPHLHYQEMIGTSGGDWTTAIPVNPLNNYFGLSNGIQTACIITYGAGTNSGVLTSQLMRNADGSGLCAVFGAAANDAVFVVRRQR